MARDANKSRSSMSTTEARKSLPSLAKRAAQRRRPGKGLRDNAVEIHPRGETGRALLVPEVDIAEAERRIAELEETLEDIELIRLVEERVRTGKEQGTPIDEVIREFGFEKELLGEEPAG
jgi:hypothetical protein